MPKINAKYIRIFYPGIEKIGNIFRWNDSIIDDQLFEISKLKKIKSNYICSQRHLYAASFTKKPIEIQCHFCNKEILNEFQKEKKEYIKTLSKELHAKNKRKTKRR